MMEEPELPMAQVKTIFFVVKLKRNVLENSILTSNLNALIQGKDGT